MRLNTRLFLFVGLLLLIICLVDYFVPTYIVRQAAQSDRERFVQRTVQERISEQRRYSYWIQEELSSAKATLDAFLFLAAGHRGIELTLQRDGHTLEHNVWLQAAHLLSLSNTIDFLQVTQKDGPTATLTLGNATLYEASSFQPDDGPLWVVLTLMEPHESTSHAYVAVWLPRAPQEGEGAFAERPKTRDFEIFLLFDPAKLLSEQVRYTDLAKHRKKVEEKLADDSPYVKELILSLIDQLAAAESYLSKTFGTESPQNMEALQKFTDSLIKRLVAARERAGLMPAESLLIQDSASTSFMSPPGTTGRTAEFISRTFEERTFSKRFQQEVRRISDLEMIGALGFLSSVGILSNAPFQEWVPAGAATLMLSKERGTAVLSQDVFSDKPDFDSEDFLSAYPPPSDSLPIGSAFALFQQGQAGPLTVANAMILEAHNNGSQDKTASGFLALGTSLNGILDTISEVSGLSTFLIYKDRVVGQVLRPQANISEAAPAELVARSKELQTHGFITLDGQDWYYLLFQPDPQWEMRLITLEPAATVLGAAEEFIKRSHEITRAFTTRIIFVALGILVISLLILEFLGRHFTRPISMLAKATEKISTGHLEEVKLPSFRPGSKNEISILTRAFSNMVDGLAERERLRGVLDKVVSKEIANEILKGKISLGGDLKEATVLFNDIRDFTHLTEKLPPEGVITLLNSYMTEMSDIIQTHQGVIDKYVGDAVMAVFGAPVPHRYSPLQAVLSALLMRQRLIEWNERRKTQGLLQVVSGTGIHTGPMIAGNMGAENRLNYTVLGANVNKASRLCDEAQGMEILISQEMVDKPQIADTIEVEERPPVILKGFSQPAKVYRVLGLKQQSLLGELSQFVKRFSPEDESPPEIHQDTQ